MVQHLLSSVVKGIARREVRGVGGGYMDKFLRDNSPRTKDGSYVTNLGDKKSKQTHWISLFIDGNIAVYFDSFENKYIPQKVLSQINHKSITRNIFRILDNFSLEYGFYCIAFIEYTPLGKNFMRIIEINFLLMIIKRMPR